MKIRIPSRGFATFVLVRVWCVLFRPRLLLHFIRRTGRLPDPANPRTVEEKFLWRKLFDHNPLFVVVTDKLRVKEYIRRVMPDLKLAKLLWSGDDPLKIPDSLLRGNVVIKANNGSRRNLMVRDGNVDRRELERLASAWISARYGQNKGEWAYRHVDQGILIEEMLLTHGIPVNSEYKCHVGGGRTSYVYTKLDGGTPAEREIVLSRDGVAYAIDDAESRALVDFPITPIFGRMCEIAETLARPFDFVRCDLYDVEGEIYFSELTIYPSSGYGTVMNRRLSEQRNLDWDIRRSWFLSTPQKGWRRLYADALRKRISDERSRSLARDRSVGPVD